VIFTQEQQAMGIPCDFTCLGADKGFQTNNIQVFPRKWDPRVIRKMTNKVPTISRKLKQAHPAGSHFFQANDCFSQNSKQSGADFL
jgi:hypothetical protein